MRIFTLDEDYSVVCNWEKTKYGFRHIAILHKNGFEIAKSKACYYNRTWESFEYESVLRKIIEDNFKGKEKDIFILKIKETN